MTKNRVKFPLRVRSSTVMSFIDGNLNYITKNSSKVFSVPEESPHFEHRTFWFLTNRKVVSFTQEADFYDDWLWVKLENGFLWPADGPADRQMAFAKYYRKRL